MPDKNITPIEGVSARVCQLRRVQCVCVCVRISQKRVCLYFPLSLCVCGCACVRKPKKNAAVITLTAAQWENVVYGSQLNCNYFH